MGSCLGTNFAEPPPKTPNSAAAGHHNGCNKSPPPVVYEETVKEVLSETPAITKHRLLPNPRFYGMLHQNGGTANKPAAAFDSDDPSDVDYEIHSTHSESYSMENGDPLRRRRGEAKPFPGEVKREKVSGRSPALRSDTFPGRVKPGYRSGRITGGEERSGRRSSSLVTHSDSGSSKTYLDASKSSRKMGNYTGRMEYGSGDRIRKGKEEGRRPPTSNELLESSFVSLECIIFL